MHGGEEATFSKRFIKTNDFSELKSFQYHEIASENNIIMIKVH